jgi:fatty acid amide hydrolase
MNMSSEIHQLDATDLLQKLEAKELSSVEIVRALYDRADKVDGRIRSLVIRFDEAALAQAKRADEARDKGESLGPLHGLPITIKESIATEGDEITLGVLAKKGERAKSDAVVVRLLREAGAIVIAKTNVSQLLLFHESANPVYGATNNPWSDDHVPGGSSGGEAAAIAAGITPLGVGTDIGGSIRVPSAFTGTAGLKPTVDRWSNVGCHTSLMGQEAVRGQVGPMARTARDVALLFRAIDSPLHSKLDPMVSPLSTEDPVLVKLDGLKIGFYVDDGFLAASPSIARAVNESAALLEACGATVVPFSPRQQAELMDTYFAALSSDGGVTARAHLAGGPMADQLKNLMKMAGMPRLPRKLLAKAAGLSKEPRIANLLNQIGEKSVATLWQLTAKRSEIRVRVFQHWLREGIDVVICPAFTTPAIRHGQADDFSMAGCYSMRYNFLNFPAGVVPIHTVGPKDKVRNQAEDRLEKKAVDVELHSQGLPLGVQIVGRPYEENKVLAVMLALEAKAREIAGFPNTPVP